MKRLTLLVFSLALLVSVSYAGATSKSYTREVTLTSTPWSTTITLPKFDSSLGTLDSVFFQLIGHVEGSAMVENMDASPATITADLSATLTMKRPDGVVIITAVPLISKSEDLDAYDNSPDFGGVSGRTYDGLAKDVTETLPTTDAVYLAMFTGDDDIILPVTATASSNGSGAGNLLQQFSTSASATATVTYNYTPVPEPAAFPVLLMGIMGTAFKLWRKDK